ncbi:MAG: endonuclease domain-containing protein [Melioribacteraceae bacterium]
MSLTSRNQLAQVAKIACRDLRKNQTKAEEIFWEAVRNKKFNGKKFYRQYPIFHDISGRETFFIADFYCYEEKLVIELDGEIHKYKLMEDEHRTEIINYLGISVVRFKNEEVTDNLSEVLEKTKKYFSS